MEKAGLGKKTDISSYDRPPGLQWSKTGGAMFSKPLFECAISYEYAVEFLYNQKYVWEITDGN